VNHDEVHDAELRAIAQGLGARAAEGLDVDATTRAVLERLRAAPPRSRWSWRRPVWLPLAAALVVVLGTSLVLRAGRRHPTPAAHVLTAAGVDLNQLSPDQLRDVLGTLDGPADDQTAGAGTDWDDLTAPELRSLLRAPPPPSPLPLEG